jgi:hypothetical protein
VGQTCPGVLKPWFGKRQNQRRSSGRVGRVQSARGRVRIIPPGVLRVTRIKCFTWNDNQYIFYKSGAAMQRNPSAAATHFIEAASQFDRRRSRRVTARLRAKLSARGRLFWARRKAFIVEYSMLGLRVRSEAGLTSGQVVRVASETNPAQPTVCRVVWVGRVGSRNEGEAGLAFLDLVG